ncbi:MAG: hypothetical protein GDA36_07690 [Rhodobacteraceae bacterium]|nr:hypothetical protein [Paracoccaceae bacterium]
MRRLVAVFATHDDLLAKVYRQIGDHGLQRWKVPPRPGSHIDAPQDRAKVQAPDDLLEYPPDDLDMHFSADTQARWVRNSAKRTPGDKMTSNGFTGPDEARTMKASSTRPARHLRTGPRTRV